MGNKGIRDAQKIHKVFLIVTFIVQIVICIVLNCIILFELKPLEIESKYIPILQIAANVLCVVLSAMVDVLLYKKIKRYGRLLDVRPVEGVVEDVIVLRYGGGRDATRSAHLLVRNAEDGKLYFTYGDYDLSFYKSSIVLNAGSSSNVGIYKNNGDIIDVGSPVWLYIGKILDPQPRVKRKDERRVYFNGRRYLYSNVNKLFNIGVFENVVFFDGAIDVNRFFDEETKGGSYV